MEEVVRQLQLEIGNNAWIKHFKIQVEGFNGEANLILLTGQTQTFYQKQIAQEIVLRVVGGRWAVENQIIVKS